MRSSIHSISTLSNRRAHSNSIKIPLYFAGIVGISVLALHYLRVTNMTLSLFYALSMTICAINLRVNPTKDTQFAGGTYIIDSILLGVLFSAFIKIIQFFVSSDHFSINQIIGLSFTSLSFLSFLLLTLWSTHIIFYKIQTGLSSQTKNNRLVHYSIISIIVIIISYRSVELSLLSALLCAIYFLLLDLFCDQKKLHIIWLVLWTIILGSFLAFFIFHLERSQLNKENIPLIDAFSLFSLIFVLSALLYIPIAFLNGKWNILPGEWNFSFDNRSQLGNRVQFSILIALVFSFAAIGIVSIYQIKMLAPLEITAAFQRSFTQALLNTYVFLFLIGFVISITLSEYIRTPLVELGKKLKAVELNKENIKIEWDGNDEIANLIQEYNQMIDQLQDNAELLAHTERDSAWREMSKQVAHEIKNPLTPMKLSLQHLERSIINKRENIEELTLKMCNTLMNQVENLRQIAEEFSNFGSLPKTNNEKILLNDIVETIHDLFRKRDDMEIKLIEPIDDIRVYADKNHLVRILNNLVKNSIQAIPTDRKGEIELKLWKDGTKAIIRVRDNGIGISDEMQSYIFKPKFTTKSSGSGLGLAIAANMVDSIGGSIYFKSVENKGTDFFVELPLVRSTFSDDLERVSL